MARLQSTSLDYEDPGTVSNSNEEKKRRKLRAKDEPDRWITIHSVLTTCSSARVCK